MEKLFLDTNIVLDHREWLDEVTSGDYQRYYERMYGQK